MRQARGMQAEVMLGCNQEWHPVDGVVMLNIEEDIQGRDVMTFECPTCKREHKSFVVVR